MAIDTINQTITELATFPDRTNYGSSSTYALAVATWLSEEGVFSGELSDLVSKLETMITQINNDISGVNTSATDANNAATSANSSEDKAGKWAEELEDVEVETGKYSAKHYSLKAAGSVASLPTGTINDAIIATDKAWSSTKINSELSNYEPVDATILKDADIDTTVQAYNSTNVLQSDYATATIGGTVKVRLNGTVAYITNNGSDA